MKKSKLERFATWEWKFLSTELLFFFAASVNLFAAWVMNSTLPARWHYAIAFVFFTSGTDYAAALVCSRVRKLYEEKLASAQAEFDHIFGKMSVDPFVPGVQQIIQLRVDTILTQLADRFNDASRYQEDYLKEIKAASGNRAKVEEMLGKVNILAQEVRIAKVKFWNAHRSAKNREYKVKDSFKEYLETESSQSPQPGNTLVLPSEARR